MWEKGVVKGNTCKCRHRNVRSILQGISKGEDSSCCQCKKKKGDTGRKRGELGTALMLQEHTCQSVIGTDE